MSYHELREECSRDGIGPLFWDLFVEVVGRICRRYPPEAYGNVGSWSKEAIDDLAQDVALDRLIHENQLDYVLSLATNEDSLSRILAFQVQRVLAHRRATTVVDRLINRLRELVREQSEFRFIELSHDSFITLAEGGREPGDLSDTDVRHGSAVIDSIPRLVTSPAAKRESKVYHRKDLYELLRLLVETFEGISLRDIRKILEITLTAWLPTILHEHEKDWADETSLELKVERTEMTSVVEKFAANLEPERRVVLLGKAQGLPDGEIAQRLDRSRPWVAKRKCEVLEMLEMNVIAQISAELHTEAVQLLLDELAILGSQDE